jgi:hypothetical protein
MQEAEMKEEAGEGIVVLPHSSRKKEALNSDSL